MVEESNQLNEVIMSTGGWGLAAVLMLVIAWLAHRLLKVMEERHAETNDILKEVTTAMLNSAASMNDLRDEMRGRQ